MYKELCFFHLFLMCDFNFIFVFYESGKYRYFHEDDNYEIFIIHAKRQIDHFWIIPRTILLEKGYISTKIK